MQQTKQGQGTQVTYTNQTQCLAYYMSHFFLPYTKTVNIFCNKSIIMYTLEHI